MQKIVKLLLASAMLLQVLCVGNAQAARPTVPGAVVVQAGDALVMDRAYYSPNRRYFLVFQSTDGNLVVYRGTSNPSNAIWSTGGGRGATGAYFQTDNNFVLYRGATIASNAVWASGSDFQPGEPVPPGPVRQSLMIFDNGSLYIERFGGRQGWQTPADPVQPPVACTTPHNYPICNFPNSASRFTSWATACTESDARTIARQMGAAWGACNF